MAKKSNKKYEDLDKQKVKDTITEMFSSQPNIQFTLKQLVKFFDIKSDKFREIVKEVLEELSKERTIEEISSGRFRYLPASTFVTGVIDLTAKGTAYVITEELPEDIFIPQVHLKHALNGDKVRVAVYAHSKKRRPEGEVVEILERKKETFVGVIQRSSQYAFLIPSGKQMPYDIFVPLNSINGAKDGDKAIVKITEWPENQKNPVGKVLEVLGRPGDNDTEMNAIMAEFELPVKFPTNVEKAAEKIEFSIPNEEIKKREDFRSITTFTIDPKDAKDFDDALSIQKLDTGNYQVGVHIADVSHYVSPDTTLDKEAYSRATSVYLVDRTVPMLPEKLSNGVCSLRPKEEKLCFSAVFELDKNAKVVKEWFGRTVINSDRRFTYEEAQEIIEGKDGDFKDEILLLNTLAEKLRAERFRSGSIDFDRIEVRFDIDETGKPIGVYFKESKEANKLIEEFMLLANRKVAEFIGKTKGDKKPKTFVYRVHDKPNMEKITDFNRFISKFGYKLQTTNPNTLAISMNKLLDELKDRPEQNMIETLAIRTMAKAVYSTENIGHYGLGFEYYSHFTSPIRRYPDVMTHRLLQRYLDKGRSVKEDKYEEICKHCSEMEQVAANAERASIKYKQVEYMSFFIGETFLGTISGVTNWGFFVELNDTKCEGLVSISELEGDYYEFDEENYCIVGRHHRKVYQLGDQVLVKVAKANLISRQLDFTLAENTTKTTVNKLNRETPKKTQNQRRGRKGNAPLSQDKKGKSSRGGNKKK